MNAISSDETLSPTKRALLEIRELRARLALLERTSAEPIAIVGLGCRLPGGANDEASLWRVLRDGVDTIDKVPADRWNGRAIYDGDPDHPGTSWNQTGGFLDNVARFDASFFGISPREAASMDPQQRLMLEVAWEAFENAAIAPDGLESSATGVYVGVGNSDYGRMLLAASNHIDAYAGSGGSVSVIAGRIAYLLGLQGPALVVDTACSSSLVAVHLACQALRRGECNLALVGGVNVMLSADAHIALTKARMISPDGRCKTFDAAADGYGRGEGAAAIVLRRLSDAKAQGERVLAVIRGSAVNQDGRSSGLTSPNGPAQEVVIRAALADGHLAPSTIDYVEAHGTGTSLGDPIELQALAAALGEGRPPERPLLVGSCKTNFGHLEAAAGITGLLKVVLALRHRSIPPHLHLKVPNPLVDWASLPLHVATKLQPWPKHTEPSRAGVSSFGFSGTNAHVILEEAPPLPDEPIGIKMERALHVLTMSARDEAGLGDLARRYEESFIEGGSVADLCYTANIGRVHQAHRTSILGTSAADFEAGLSAFLSGQLHPTVVTGSMGRRSPVVGFLFTGQGAQYHGMARQLYQTSPVFRAVIDECDSALGTSFDLVGALYSSERATSIDETAIAQPAIFAVEMALAELWRSFGIEPSYLIGHSLGEYAAACVAGVLSREDGVRLLVERGRITQELLSDGAMASVLASAATVDAAIASIGANLSLAAYNGPEHVVVSGARPEVDKLLAYFSAHAIRCRPLRVSHAFHSALIEPSLDPFAKALAKVSFAPSRIPIISNLDGHIAERGELAQASYWLQQMRSAVHFEQCIQTALKRGVTHFVEIGPHPVLLGMAAECAAGSPTIQWLASMRRDVPDWSELLNSLQHLYVAGSRIDWRGFDGPYGRRVVTAPPTQFQRRRYWIDWSTSPPYGEIAQTGKNWHRLSSALTRQSQQAPLGLDLSEYAEKWSALQHLTGRCAAIILHKAGIFVKAGERANPQNVLQRLGASPLYLHLIERWLQLLAESKALRKDGNDYVSDLPLKDDNLEVQLAKARVRLNDAPLSDYLENCGRRLFHVITGKASALETLFPDGSFDLAENLYRRSTPMQYFNALAAAAVECLITARGASPMRVLEIGAGTGGTTSSLLSLFLSHSSTTYWFTDVTPVFLDRARTTFGDIPFLRFGKFDLERDAAAQGFADGSFDLIVAANAVHATRNLRDALRRIRSMLAPGGTLLLIESTEHLSWFDMSTGLIEGWQHFDDDLRDDNPLLPAAAWLPALRDAGFDEVGAWPAEGTVQAHLGQRVIAAWVSGDPAEASQAGITRLSDQLHESTSIHSVLRQPSPRREPAKFVARLAAAVRDEQLEMMRDFVRQAVAQVLRLDADQSPGSHERLMELGLDSLMAIQLRNLLGAGLGLAKPLSASLMFDYPTIEALVEHLLNHLGPVAPVSAATTREAAAEIGVRFDAQQLAEMSESDVEAILLKRLGAE
jgi:acyl transferase domain-containing protein/SAM-dependent methyltransferase